jgi:hypothetical protein
MPEDAAEHETALLASFEQMETRPFPPPEEGTAVIFSPRPMPEPVADVVPEVLPELEPEQVVAPEPVLEAEQEPTPELIALAAMEFAPTPPVSEAGPEAAVPGETDFDPTDFLFGPEPEPDPAAFLLDPAPQPAASAAVLLPQPEFVSTPPEQPEAEQPQAVAPAPTAEDPQPAPHDPLHALKAMSPEERLAIFS